MAGKSVSSRADGRGHRPRGRIIVRHQIVEHHPKVGDKQYLQDWQSFRNGIGPGFEIIYGLPRQLLRGDYLARVEGIVKGEYPLLRKSAARLFLEGALTGDKGPLQTMPVGSRARVEKALRFLDVLETMVYAWGLRKLDELNRLAIPVREYRSTPVLEGRGKTPVEVLNHRKRGRPRKVELTALPPPGAVGGRRVEEVIVDDPDEEVDLDGMSDEAMESLEAMLESLEGEEEAGSGNGQ